MADASDLMALMRAIASAEQGTAERLIQVDPALSLARLDRSEECFLVECRAQVYAGDTALHAAAFAYDTDIARRLVAAGADVRARNRQGAEPMHAATLGSPGSDRWAPERQAAVITYLASVGADPNATAAGGVTPLHRAVRNRCTGAVRALLEVGADPRLANGSGSTALDLAGWTTGRGGTGSPEAKAEQQRIVDLLTPALG